MRKNIFHKIFEKYNNGSDEGKKRMLDTLDKLSKIATTNCMIEGCPNVARSDGKNIPCQEHYDDGFEYKDWLI